MKNAWINQQLGPWSPNETMLSFEIYGLASRIPLFGGTTTITMGDDIRITCSSFLFLSCWSQDADFVSFTPVKWVNVQCFKTSPDARWVQNKITIYWMEGHYCHLNFALLISLSTEQLAISSLLPLFLLQTELLLIFAQKKHTGGSHTKLV